ncbi:hypothetical protein THAOC_02016, partial [Thalassiosira oceanica]
LLGVIRPVSLTDGIDLEADWDGNVDPVRVSSTWQPAVSEKLRSQSTAKWGVSNVHCCTYYCSSGRCFWTDWDNEKGLSDWQGQERLQVSSTIGLLLDLNEGTLSVFKNGRRLGAMKEGLGGEYCWFVTVGAPCTLPVIFNSSSAIPLSIGDYASLDSWNRHVTRKGTPPPALDERRRLPHRGREGPDFASPLPLPLVLRGLGSKPRRAKNGAPPPSAPPSSGSALKFFDLDSTRDVAVVSRHRYVDCRVSRGRTTTGLFAVRNPIPSGVPQPPRPLFQLAPSEPRQIPRARRPASPDHAVPP